MSEKRCECDACQKVRRWETTLNLTTPEAKQVFEEMLQELELHQTDAAWAEMVLTGKWPGSVEILENALEIAKRYVASEAVATH